MKHKHTVVAAIVLVGAVTVVAATAAYTLSVANSVDAPERTITIDGEDFTVSEISRFEPDSPVDVSVEQSGGDDSYRVRIYNSDREIQATSRRQSGDSELTFSTDGWDAGSYLVAVDDNGFQEVHPLVIQGYDVTTDTRTTVEPGEEWEVTVDLAPYDQNPSVENVEVVLFDDASEVVSRTTATDEGDLTYTATKTAPSQEDTYKLQTYVRGTDEVDGQDENEIIAVDPPTSIQVDSGSSDPNPTDTPTETDTPTQTPTPTPGGTATPTPSETETPTPNGTDTPTPGETDTPTPNGSEPTSTPDSTVTSTREDTDSGGIGGSGGGSGGGTGNEGTSEDRETDTSGDTSGDTPRDTAVDDDGSTPETVSATATDQGVITPNKSTPLDSPGAGAADTQDAPGFVVVAVCLLGWALLAHRRSR